MSGLIVHEWVEKAGGSEKVVDQFAAEFPDADIFVLWNNDPGRFGSRVTESWIARTPLRKSKALALPFELPVWRRVPARREYDWLLSSSHLLLTMLGSQVRPGCESSYTHIHPRDTSGSPNSTSVERRDSLEHLLAS